MDDQQRAKAVEWFQVHVPPVCPSCQKVADFHILDELVTPIIFAGGGWRLGGAQIPLIGLMCMNCYNVRFFSAVMMKLVPSRSQNETTSSPAERTTGTPEPSTQQNQPPE